MVVGNAKYKRGVYINLKVILGFSTGMLFTLDLSLFIGLLPLFGNSPVTPVKIVQLTL